MCGKGTLFGLVSSLGFTFLLSQLVRDRGKARELWLFENWGGKPSAAMLRYSDPRLNVNTRARYHKRLSAMLPEISLPTVEEEKKVLLTLMPRMQAAAIIFFRRLGTRNGFSFSFKRTLTTVFVAIFGR